MRPDDERSDRHDRGLGHRALPCGALLLVLLVSLFSPLDLIPDFLPGVGVIDDMVLFGFLVRLLLRDGRTFREWKDAAATPPPP